MSFLGSSMVTVTLAFAVLDLSNSAAALGIVLAARSVPQVAFMLLGSVISDRVSRSTVMVVSNALLNFTRNGTFIAGPSSRPASSSRPARGGRSPSTASAS